MNSGFTIEELRVFNACWWTIIFIGLSVWLAVQDDPFRNISCAISELSWRLKLKIRCATLIILISKKQIHFNKTKSSIVRIMKGQYFGDKIDQQKSLNNLLLLGSRSYHGILMTIECLKPDDLISLRSQIGHDKAVIEEILNRNNISWHENQKVREYLELYQKLIDRLNQVYDPVPSLADYLEGLDLTQLRKNIEREFGTKQYKLARFFLLLQETDLCSYPDYQIGTPEGRKEYGVMVYEFLEIERKPDYTYREFTDYKKEDSDSKEVKKCLALIEKVKLSEKK